MMSDTFQLREGMFCRDANGQKVGPMLGIEETDKFHYEESIGTFNVDGTTSIGCDPDIISEWQDNTPAADGWSDWMSLEETKEYVGGSLWGGAHQVRSVDRVYTYSVPVSRKAVKRERVDLFWHPERRVTQGQSGSDTHRISFDLVNGVPDCSTIKMEEL